MKSLVLVAALAALPAFAQTSSEASSAAVSSPNNAQSLMLNNTFNTPGYTTGYSQGYAGFRTNQANSAAPAFSTGPQWRCSQAGWGLSAQVVGGGFAAAGPGGESAICGIDFRIAVNDAIDKKTGNERAVAIKIACADQALADAWEGTDKQCPDTRDTKAKRENRWEAAKQPVAAASAPTPVVASSDPYINMRLQRGYASN